jgi:hypothetical protein
MTSSSSIGYLLFSISNVYGEVYARKKERTKERGRAAKSSLFSIGACGLWLVDKLNWMAEFVFKNAAFQLFVRKTTFR